MAGQELGPGSDRSVHSAEDRWGVYRAHVAAALDISERTVFRAKRRYVEGGMELVLRQHNSPTPRCKVDEKVQAHLIALACSSAPEGHNH